MKILLITIPPLDPTTPPAIFSILGSCCNKVGWEYEVFDFNLHIHKSLDEQSANQLINDLKLGEFRSKITKQNYDQLCNDLVDAIGDYNPSMIALSLLSYMSQFSTLILLKKLSSLQKSYKIVIGGSGISTNYIIEDKTKLFSNFCLDNKLIDYYITGEGEIAFMELLKGNTDYPGINSKDSLQITDLNSLPMPTYEKINHKNYFFGRKPEVIVTGSRGCVRDCTFCDVGHYWNRYIYKSGKRMAQELFEIWKSTGVTVFQFSDSLINGSISSFREFNTEIIQIQDQYPEFKPSYRGQFICRPVGQLKEHDYQLMSLAGAETLVIGIESFSDSVRSHIRKKFSNDDIDYHFELCAKYNIKNVLLIMSGYPTETLDDHKTNLYYLKKYQVYALSRIIYSINIEVGGLILLPNSGVPLNEMENDLQIIYNNHNPNHSNWISLTNPNLTSKERFRRSVEVIYTAYSLGYNVLHMNQKIDSIEQMAKKYL